MTTPMDNSNSLCYHKIFLYVTVSPVQTIFSVDFTFNLNKLERCNTLGFLPSDATLLATARKRPKMQS